MHLSIISDAATLATFFAFYKKMLANSERHVERCMDEDVRVENWLLCAIGEDVNQTIQLGIECLPE